MPVYKMDEVARRLGVKHYWLQARLGADRRRPEPKLQFHYYRGVTPQWTHDQLASLQRAIAAELETKRRSVRAEKGT